MQQGNWVPVDKRLRGEFKYIHDRPLSKIEAAYSLQLDYDNGGSATIAGYAKQWGWSRKKVRTFLTAMGATVTYPEETTKKQNQRGQIGLQIGNRSGTDEGQIRLIDSNGLRKKGNRKGTDKGQIGNRSGNTPNNPNPNPKETTKIAKRLIDCLNKTCNGSFTYAESNLEFIRGRLNSGFTEDDCSRVLALKWKDPDFKKRFFRPKTLFRTSNFEGYLNEANAAQRKKGPMKQPKEPCSNCGRKSGDVFMGLCKACQKEEEARAKLETQARQLSKGGE